MKHKALQEKIGWTPHINQEKIIKSEGRDVVICAGRRFGKSAICAYIALKCLLEGDIKGKPVKIWIVSPTYDLSQKVFEYLVKWFIKACPSQRKGVSYNPSAQIRTARGGLVQCKSAENPAGLLGEELDLLIVDECSRVKRDVYDIYLYPTTISRQARRFFISTPFGKNWFWEHWVRANEQGNAFQYATTDNPTLPDIEHELEHAKRTLPTAAFEQEFLAQFKEGASSVFRGTKDCINPELDGNKKPTIGHRYIMGLDLAKINDFTVITIIDKANHEVVFHDRFQKIPYTLIKERIVQAAKRFNAKIVIDGNNIGGALADELQAIGLNVTSFKAQGSMSKDLNIKGSKEQLIEKLSLFIEDKNISLPAIPVLIDELESFGYELSESGRLKYSAPTGLHDDCVDSLALAVWTLKGKAKLERQLANKSMPNNKTKKFQYA